MDPRSAHELHAVGVAGQPGQGERRESATELRLDGDEVAADADDSDAVDFSGTYMVLNADGTPTALTPVEERTMAETIVQYETLRPTGEVLALHRRAIEESGKHVLEEPKIELVPNPSYVGGISDAPRDVYRLTFRVEAVDRQPQASTSTKVKWWGWALFTLVLLFFIFVFVASFVVNNT